MFKELLSEMVYFI